MDLPIDEMRFAMGHMIDGRLSAQETAFLLTGLHRKGETVAEIVGAAEAMRARMTSIHTRRHDTLDTCGTGGDRSGTFNISTAAALVVAAAGVAVAKHGNRSVTSKSGSADVLAEFGVNLDAGLDCVEQCLDELGIGFCFAPLFHESMRHVAAVRRQLGFPTIFNLLGPLTNPAKAPFQVIGVGDSERRRQIADALASLGTRHAVVVCGEDGLDEVTLSGTTHISEVRQDPDDPARCIVKDTAWKPEDFGIRSQAIDSLRVANPAESASVIRQLLEGRPGAARDIVLLNAAAALWVAGKRGTLAESAILAAEAIDRRDALQLLDRLARRTHA